MLLCNRDYGTNRKQCNGDYGTDRKQD